MTQTRVLHELIYSAKRMGNIPLAIRYGSDKPLLSFLLSAFYKLSAFLLAYYAKALFEK